MEFGGEKCTMLITKKWEKIKNGRNRTATSGKLQVLGNMGSVHHQKSGDGKKKIALTNKKTSRYQTLRRKSYQKD